MSLLETFCLTENYCYQEDFRTVQSTNCSYLSTSVEFIKSYWNFDQWLESIIYGIAEIVMNEHIEMESKTTLAAPKESIEDSYIRVEEAMERVSSGLPISFGTKPKLSHAMKKHRKEKLEKKEKINKEVLQDLTDEMFIQLKIRDNWIPCIVLDMLPPSESDLVYFCRYFVAPIVLQEKWRSFNELFSLNTITLSKEDIDFVSLELQGQILRYTLLGKKMPSYPTVIVDIEERTENAVKPKLSAGVRKYYNQRYRLFSRWDAGIQFDEIGLFSVTPEALALHTAVRCSCDMAIDAFAGIGGNTIQLARTCGRVIAIDMDYGRLAMLHHNSTIYGVQDKIDAICGDSLQLLPRMKADVVVLAPPWGGIDYINHDVFRLEDLPQGLEGGFLFRLARRITRNIVFILPKNIDRRQLASLADPGEIVEIVEGIIDGSTKMVIAYFGNLVSQTTTTSNVNTII